jgi:flagellar biosynthesis/type III secretory pathway protein FliH
MLEEEEDEEKLEKGIEEAIIQGYIEETLSIWELFHVGLETTQQQVEELTSGPLWTLSSQLSGMAMAALGTLGRFNLQNNSNQLSPPTWVRDVVLGEYHEYLHIFEARDN